MSCIYCENGSTNFCESLVSSTYEADESVSLEIDRDRESMTITTWINDNERVDAEFQIAYCPFCGERLAAGGAE